MTRVAIVGAGPGGATLAYLLARRGVGVTLLERQTDFAREFRGEVLLPGGLEPFAQMGLWDALDSVPHVELGALALYVNGRLRGRARFEGEVFESYPPRWMSQPALLEMLVARAAEHPSFELQRGVSVRGLLEADGRCVGVRVHESGGEREIRADFVVGADGRSSVVRRRARLPEHRDRTPMDVVWCKLPMLPGMDEDPHARFYLGRGHLMLAVPVYDGRVQLAWIIAKGSFGELRRRGMPECLEAMARHASPDLAEHLRRHRDDAVEPFLLDTVSDRVEEWTRPGLLVIGDAAHTMSPVGAQGLNLAIRDALVAANHLVPVLLDDDARPEALDAAARGVQSERITEVETIQRFQALPPRVLLSDTWWSRLLLNLVPPLLGVGLERARDLRFVRRFLFGVSEVRLRV